MPHASQARVRRRAARALVALATLAALAPAAGAQQPAVRFTDDVLEITPDRVAALIRGLEAEAAARPAVEQEHAAQLARYNAASEAFPARIEAYQRDLAAWRDRVDAYDRCEKELHARWEKEEEADPDVAAMKQMGARLEEPANKAKLEARMNELRERVQAAQARGDQRTLMAIADTLQREMAAMTGGAGAGTAMVQRAQQRNDARVAELAQRCGADPENERPRSPASPNDLLPKDAAQQLEAAGARGAGLTARQYAVLKERVGAWLAIRAHGRGAGLGYAFAPGEQAALTSAGPALVGHQTELSNW
jgi:hypothetical protein